jgi:uncharacterized protein YhjY with autotransporter beta-barrel domain
MEHSRMKASARYFRIPGFGVAVAAASCLYTLPALSQSLEEQYAFYLSAKCTNMQFERTDTPSTFNDLVAGQAGAELDAFCSGLPPVGGGISAETASTGVGTSPGVVDNALRRRRSALRGEQAEAGQDEYSVLTTGQGSLFLSFNYAREDQKTRRFEGGRRSDQLALVLGADRRLGSTGLLGVAGGVEDQSGEFDAGGKFSNRGYSVLLYGSWLPTPALFVDFNGGANFRASRTHRVVSFTRTLDSGAGPAVIESIAPARANSKIDQQEWRGLLLSGYDFWFGGSSLGPRVTAEYRRTHMDGTVESGATPMTLILDKQTEKSLRGGLGLQGSRAMNAAGAVFVLQLNADWWHEFADDQRFIAARFAQDLRPDPTRFRFQNQPPDRDVFTARLSLSVTMPHGFSTFASVEGLLGHSYLDRFGVALGLRKEL